MEIQARQMPTKRRGEGSDDAGAAWLLTFGVFICSSWAVYQYQFLNLPAPLTAEEARNGGFSEGGHGGFLEGEALKHVKALTKLGPHSVGSDALEQALQYVWQAAEKINETASPDVDVEVDFFHAKTGANLVDSGRFAGKTLLYSGLKHVLIRILPKHALQAAKNAILVSAHIDTVFSAEGAGDDTSNVAVMLELARGLSQSSGELKDGVIFFFNTGEEEGLNGAHSFITQHPWSETVRVAINLEAQGIGGKSGIFQAGPDPFAIENFASAAKYPTGTIVSQDLFSSGFINSATDFQIYKEIGGLSGLDFAFTDSTQVYHTKNDKLELLKPGSLQHLGENMLAFLLQTPASDLSKGKAMREEETTDYDGAIFYDILGTYMIIYHQSFAKILHSIVIVLSVATLAASVLMGGFPAVISLVLSCLSTILMILFSVVFSVPVAFVLPYICSSPVPYIASPWLIIGLFAAPALLGALVGQNLGYIILQLYLSTVYSKKKQQFFVIYDDEIKLEAERWLFKGGSVLWLALLIIGTYYKVGSSFVALFWLVPPAFAYGLHEATSASARMQLPLKFATLLGGLAVPVLITAGVFIRLPNFLVGNIVRFDSIPGSNPEWLGSVIIAVVISVIICLSLVYLLSYIHISGAKWVIVRATTALFGLSVILVSSGIVPPFTDDTARAVNVVHVVDATGSQGGTQKTSYLSLFATTPGKLTKEAELLDEGFVCGSDKVVDFVTFKVKYGCWTYDNTTVGWNEFDIPTLDVHRDVEGYETQKGETTFVIDTKTSVRWALAINTEEIEDFTIKVNLKELVPRGKKSSIDGWHIVQFAGAKDSQKQFELTLFGLKETSQSAPLLDDQRPLLKLRTDVDKKTPKLKRVLAKFPSWCSLYGKSSNPLKLAYLSSVPVNFQATRNKSAIAWS